MNKDLCTDTTENRTLIYNEDCLGLTRNYDNSVDCLITDPPYGIAMYNLDWDKQLPPKQIWQDCLRVLKPGSFGCVFSSVKLMHRIMVALEDSGFIIKDVMFWANLNGMPKSRNIGLDIDKEKSVKSEEVGSYKYVQGYQQGKADNYYTKAEKKILYPSSPEGKKYCGAGLALKPAYEPIILVQKPLDKGMNIAQNILAYGVGALNIEDTRIPYDEKDNKVGHNPHKKGRMPSNIIRTARHDDGYDKFFLVPKVRQNKDYFNTHPTIKPIELMNHLVKLVSFDDQIILDPFMGSGSTAISASLLNRNFIGYEIEKKYVDIAQTRLNEIDTQRYLKQQELFNI